jgi:tRNA dimethylallyltransferase
VDKKTKNELVREGDEVGIEALREELGRVDPEAAHRIPARDRYRIVRALEVYRATGRPLSSFTVPSVPRRKYRFLTIGLQRDRHELYERINRRVDRMMEDDRLADEVERLLSRGYGFDTPGMRAIGYREFAGYRSGEYSLDRTKELIKRNSRRYAKRQITFFRRFPEVRWFFPEDRDAVRALIAGFAPR